MKEVDEKNGRMLMSIKVGEKGQIVIPAEARKLFDIKPKETLIFLADIKKGMAIIKSDAFFDVADKILEENNDSKSR